MGVRSVAKDLGDVIGFKEFTIAQRSKYPDGGIHVQLTRGSVCHHAGAQQHRSTDILVACSEEGRHTDTTPDKLLCSFLSQPFLPQLFQCHAPHTPLLIRTLFLDSTTPHTVCLIGVCF